jgi:transposase
MKLYVGVDLHANNNFIALVDRKEKRVDQKKLPNDLFVLLDFLKPYQKDIVGIAVESTFNWYWMVDGLMDWDYPVHLANPSAMQQYSGLKHLDDKHDAFWLGQMLRLGILPEGYIYPKEDRPIRDLLRKRRHLVKLRTSLMVSLQNIISRNCGVKFRASEIKRLKEDRVSPLLESHPDLALAGLTSKEMIDQLTRQIQKIEGQSSSESS